MRLRSNGPVAALACAALSLAACDPKAGFESAAGAIDPNQKSYIDGPGTRLAAGSFNTVGIDFDLDTQIHLVARRRDDHGASLTIFGQDAQSGCSISPNAATWFAAKPATKPYRLLPFFDSRDQSGVGTLHFSSIDCKVEPYALDNALGPIDPELDVGFLVRQDGGLVLAAPWNATTTPLVSQLKRITRIGSQFLVWGDSQLIVYDRDFNEQTRFGSNVSALVEINYSSAFAVEDDAGVHSLLLDSDGQDLTFNTVDADACGLGSNAAAFGWVSVHSPCSDAHLVALGIDAFDSTDVLRFPFGVQADSRLAKIQGVPIPTTSGLLSTVSAYYLQDVDPSTGLGTLFAAKPGDDTAVQIGENAALDRAISVAERSGWSGVALVDIQNGLGRLVRWNWDGTQETLAENVDRAATGASYLANYDGHAGDQLSLDIQADVSVVQSGAPPFNSTILSGDGAWALRLGEYDGITGDLLLAQGLGSSYAAVAHGVATNQYQFTTIIPLPGFAYLADYDEKSLTGTLFVDNLALGSTLTVAHGVSDFVATSFPLPGILYAVPLGANAGLWFARAK
jgi:hypothetical protein